MSAELFKAAAGIDVAIIPYKGTAPVMNDLLGGHVPVAFGVIPPALGNIQAGMLRAIAVASPTRTSLLPDVPTFAESGMPGFESVLHYGLLAPAGTPRPIIDRLNAELRKLVGQRGGEEAHPCRWRRPDDLEPGRICRRHRPGRDQMVDADPPAQSEGRVRLVALTLLTRAPRNHLSAI